MILVWISINTSLRLGKLCYWGQNSFFRGHYQLETEPEQQSSVSEANVFLTHASSPFYSNISSTFSTLLSESLQLL